MVVLVWCCFWCKFFGYFLILLFNDVIFFDVYRDLFFYFFVFVELDECYVIFVLFVFFLGGVLLIREWG